MPYTSSSHRMNRTTADGVAVITAVCVAVAVAVGTITDGLSSVVENECL